MSTLKHVIDDLFEARILTTREKMWWDFVREVNWNKDHDYERIMKFLMKNVNDETREMLHDEYNNVWRKLHAHLDDKITGVGDDSYTDLISHVIGSGKEVYDAVMDDWKIAQKIVDTRQYVEGFQYIWHYDHEWNSLKPELHMKRAVSALQDLRQVRRQLTVMGKNGSAYKKWISYVDDLINRAKLAKQGKLEEAVKGMKDVPTNEITSKWGQILRDTKLGNIHYAVPNLFLDIQRFIVDW